MRTVLIASLYVGLSTVSPIMSAKVIAGVIPAGMITGCLAYGLVDVLNAAAGRKYAAHTVDGAALTRFVVYGIIFAVALAPPVSPPPVSVRIFAAATFGSWVAMRVVEIPVFAWMRGPFWKRYNLSSIPAQVLALLIWVPLAYVGTGERVLAIMAGGLVFRVAMALALTPLFAGLARWATVAAALTLAPPATAIEWSLDNQARQLAADSALYPWRTEDVLTVRLKLHEFARPWVNNLLVWDYGKRTTFNDKLTIGIESWGGVSPVYQVQWVTKVATVQRVGLEWRIRLP